MNKRTLLIASISLITLAVAFTAAAAHGYITLPNQVLMAGRWLAIASLVYYGFVKRNLTTTILISMVIGVEVGIDFPAFSQNLKVLSQIFLRLIKTIIAPLLFSTLVYGIAGHSNIKQVGRMPRRK